MTEEPRGLYHKYDVARLVETPTGTARAYPGPVFVLAYATDPHAAVALRAYADSVESENAALAADLREQLRRHGQENTE